jgi:molybdenum cofactor cytidylyltransferase
MDLSRALRVRAGQVVAFVGAGGKTSAIRRLISELEGTAPVLATTSTKIALNEDDLAKDHRIVEDAGGLITILSEWTLTSSLLLTGSKVQDEAKWDGLPLAQLQDVIEFSREKNVVLLIEADGAGGRSLKAPAAHEPALPHNFDLLVPVVGIDAIGESLQSERIHRPEELRNILDLDEKGKVTVEHVAALLKHPEGGMKALSLHAQLRVLINKVESDAQLSEANEIAWMALQEPKIQSVLLGAVQRDDPICEVRSRIAAIVLAAGESKRFGGNKLLHEWNGKPLLEHVLEAVRKSNVHRRVLVLGHDHEAVLESVDHEGFQIVRNEGWHHGQSTSVLAGLEAVRGDVEAAIFPLGDMPLVDAELIDAIIERHAETLAPIVAPQIGEEWGNPVLFDRVTFPAFANLTGDRGAKTLFPQFEIAAIDANDIAWKDIDLPTDLEDDEGFSGSD